MVRVNEYAMSRYGLRNASQFAASANWLEAKPAKTDTCGWHKKTVPIILSRLNYHRDKYWN